MTKTEEEIRRRLSNLKAYRAAGFFQDDAHASFAQNELEWVLGESEEDE